MFHQKLRVRIKKMQKKKVPLIQLNTEWEDSKITAGSVLLNFWLLLFLLDLVNLGYSEEWNLLTWRLVQKWWRQFAATLIRRMHLKSRWHDDITWHLMGKQMETVTFDREGRMWNVSSRGLDIQDRQEILFFYSLCDMAPLSRICSVVAILAVNSW